MAEIPTTSQMPTPEQIPPPVSISADEEKLFVPERKIFQEAISPQELLTSSGIINLMNPELWHEFRNYPNDQHHKQMLNARMEAIREKLSKNDEFQHPVQQDMINSYWRTGEIIYQAPERAKAGSFSLKLEASEWQLQTIRTILDLGQHPELHNFLDLFWRNFEKIGKRFYEDEPELAKGIKRGVLAPIAVVRIFKDMGFNVYLPTPEQDAGKATDLLMRRVKPNGKIDRVALQCKGHWAEGFDISVKKMTERKDLRRRQGQDLKEAQQWNTLLTSAQNYSKMIGGHEIIPFWVDVFGYGEGENEEDEELTRAHHGQISKSTFFYSLSGGSFRQRFEQDLTKGGISHV